MRTGKRRALALLLAAALAGAAGCARTDHSLPREDLFFAFSENELKSSRYTHADEVRAGEAALDTAGFIPLMSSGQLEIFFNEATAGIRVRDRRTGYVFGGLPADKPDDMNKTWSAIGNSLITAEYYNEEGAVKAVGATGAELDYTVSGHVFTAEVKWRSVGLSLGFRMELKGDALTFSLDDESIREEKSERLAAVYFIPFFGSVRGGERAGYLFVPDGPGALMRFGTPKNYLSGFEKRVYGADFGIETQTAAAALQSNRIAQYAAAEGTVSMPVFGVAHTSAQSAFAAYVGGGDDYAQIAAYPAGLITPYNRAFVRFLYRQTYEQPVSKSGAGVQTVQSGRNTVNPRITYEFLSGGDAGYVGMAKAYRTMLHETGVLTKMTPAPQDIPLRLDYLLSEVQREFIGTSVKTVTSLDDISGHVKTLQSAGIGRIEVTLEGWRKGGAAGSPVTGGVKSTAFGSLGSLGGLRELLGGNGRVMLSLSPFTARKGQFSMQREPAISYSQKASMIPAAGGEFLGDLYFMKTGRALSRLAADAKALRESGGEPVIGGAGLLYGEYMRGETVTRAANRARITAAFEELAQGGKITAQAPNAYLYGVTGQYTQSPMVGSQYLFETDSVPFLQIVLSGSMELFAPYTNISFYSAGDVLRQIDYNTYPSYFLTQSGNQELLKTASAHVQSSKISDWTPHIRETYEQINPVLGAVYGQFITGRAVIESGFVRTAYETGDVYINYTAAEKSAGGTAVPPLSAVYVPNE